MAGNIESSSNAILIGFLTESGLEICRKTGYDGLSSEPVFLTYIPANPPRVATFIIKNDKLSKIGQGLSLMNPGADAIVVVGGAAFSHSLELLTCLNTVTPLTNPSTSV